MKTTFLALALLGLTVFINGCSIATENCDSVNQDRIHQQYSAHYDQGENVTSATAQFRFGDGTGTTLDMSGKCSIKHDQYPLTAQKFLGTSYVGDGSGLKTNHQFVFEDANGKEYTNSGEIVSTAFKNLAGSYKRSEDLTVSWEGNALGANETILLKLTSDTYPEESVSTSEYSEGATSITIKAMNLKSLFLGTKKLKLTREKSISLQQAAGSGGRFSASYTTSAATFNLTE